jgi:hypothetical protein
MKRSMSQRSYLGWQRYWREEPWGPWRDNLHAAIIAREIARPNLRPGSKYSLSDAFYRPVEEKVTDGRMRVINFLKLIARPRSEKK